MGVDMGWEEEEGWLEEALWLLRAPKGINPGPSFRVDPEAGRGDREGEGDSEILRSLTPCSSSVSAKSWVFNGLVADDLDEDVFPLAAELADALLALLLSLDFPFFFFPDPLLLVFTPTFTSSACRSLSASSVTGGMISCSASWSGTTVAWSMPRSSRIESSLE